MPVGSERPVGRTRSSVHLPSPPSRRQAGHGLPGMGSKGEHSAGRPCSQPHPTRLTDLP